MTGASVTEEIKDRLDIVELIGQSVKLRARQELHRLLPVPPNTRTPAFVVFPDTGTWRCFGACNEGGDIFKFVMKKEGWDFPEALRRLAERPASSCRAAHARRGGRRRESHGRLRDPARGGGSLLPASPAPDAGRRARRWTTSTSAA